MSAQWWKLAVEDPRVRFRCPWCDVGAVSPVFGRYEQKRTIWLLAGCPNVPCRRGVLISIPSKEPWARLETGDDGLLLSAACVLPRPEQHNS